MIGEGDTRLPRLVRAAGPAVYPSTLYTPAAYPNLSDPDERRRLSPAAVRGFRNIVRHWQVPDREARLLLGGISHGAFAGWKAGTVRELNQDCLLRISYLIGIFKSLNILFSQPLADRWVQLPNRNAIFGNRTPLEYMLAGGAPAMDTVRRLLDARRGG